MVVRGSTDNIMDDIERAVDDGVNTFKALARVRCGTFSGFCHWIVDGMRWGSRLEEQDFWDDSRSLYSDIVGGKLITEVTLMPNYPLRR